MTTLYVAGLWRYPVKSLAGERLPVAALSADGVHGDRLVQVHGPEGVRTSRRHYRLLGLRGTLDPEVLRDIGRRFGGRLALNAEVTRDGLIRVGDAVTLAP